MKRKPNIVTERNRADLSNSNQLAFNGARAKRISRINTQSNEGAFDCKLAPNPTNAPPIGNPDQEDCCDNAINNHLLHRISQMIAQIEFRHYSKIGKIVKPTNNLSALRTYFNKSAVNSALAALFCTNYYNKEMMTKSQVAWHLGISRNATSDKIDHCVNSLYFMKERTRYGAAPIFMSAYLEYADQEIEYIKSKISDYASLVTVYNKEKNTN